MKSNGNASGAFNSSNYETMKFLTMHPNSQAAYRSLQEHIDLLTHDIQGHEQQFNKLLDHLHGLVNDVQFLHHQYDEVVNEKTYFESLLAQAGEHLQDVCSIVGRYTSVKDAVVASDGFTYERSVITEYIESCKKDGGTPMSCQTEVPLTSLLIPNRSLKTLLDRLIELLNNANNTRCIVEGNHNTHDSPNINTTKGSTASTAPTKGGGVNTNGPASHYDPATSGSHNRDVEVNALGERLHPCIRVYGFCNYKDVCAYAKYPYDACLSNLKGKCRFRNQCHERHVEFRGALDDYGKPVTELNTNNTATGTITSGSAGPKEKSETK